jgi:hypothetical protein
MSTKYQVWVKDYESGCWMPLGWSPTFTSVATGEAWLAGDHDWEAPVRLQEVEVCEDCGEHIGNSVFEEVHGYTRCHSCLTTTSKLINA